MGKTFVKRKQSSNPQTYDNNLDIENALWLDSNWWLQNIKCLSKYRPLLLFYSWTYVGPWQPAGIAGYPRSKWTFLLHAGIDTRDTHEDQKPMRSVFYSKKLQFSFLFNISVSLVISNFLRQCRKKGKKPINIRLKN